MGRDIARVITVSVVLLASAASLFPIHMKVSADPWTTNNPDGTSDAVWNFSNPADYTRMNTEIVNNNATLERQPTFWWNSTTVADFSGPDSMTNVNITRWPGDVAMSAASGASTLLTLQPGAAGEDSWLDSTHGGTNYGAATTMTVAGQKNSKRPILRFDISTIPANAVIDGATLSLYLSAGAGNPITTAAHLVTAQWNEVQATWNNRLAGVHWTKAGGDYNPRVIDQTIVNNTIGWKTWNVTQLVDLWYRGRLTNYGLILENPNNANNQDKTFYSSDYAAVPTLRPKLDIRYRVIGVTGEYISKVGGPGTMAAWKNISWNPSIHDFVSDGFNGVSLDPKWNWTNLPTSYDVGTTTPGSLHVLSRTGVDLNGGTFTGNILSQGLVGDFTATMDYSVNPAVNAQKSGLMVLVNSRNWYAIGKENVGGPRNWRAYATDDATTTIRANVASPNPVPAWVRIQRVGNTFTSSTSADGVTWTVQDTYNPAFEYPLGVRVAFFVADGLSGTALPADVDYIRFTLANDATVTVQTRIGNTTPVDPSWTGWSPIYPSPATSTMAGTSRYVEYRLGFSVINPGHMPIVGDLNISYFRYPSAGTVETNDLVPTDLSAWGNLSVIENLNGETISYAYSLDSGGSWNAVVPPSSLSAVSIATGRIRFRASLSTANTLVTPSLSETRLTYTHRLDHFYVTTPSSAVAGAPFTVTVMAKDAGNATLTSWNGTVTLAARLQDGMTPGGGVLGSTSLTMPASGIGTLTTETYTKAETVRIFSHFGTVTGIGENMTVSPAPIDRIAITPDNVTVSAFGSQVFTAQAYDVYNNTVAGVNFTWVVGGGVGSLNITWGRIVFFTANPPAANGTLEASFGGVLGTAQIHVISGTPPWIAISFPVPGALLTGVVPITYTNSSDSVSVQFECNDGTGWTLIGNAATLNGTYYWDTSGLNFANGDLLAIVSSNSTTTNMTIVSPIEVDNTPPTIAIGTVTDNQAVNGTLMIDYVTAPDVVHVDFTYFDIAWQSVGSDLTIDGSYLWTPGLPINGVTLRAVAVDHVNLTGWDEKHGVGNYTIGPAPPSIAPIPDLHVCVGSAYRLNLTFYISDPDTPLAALGIWDSDPANVTANPGAYPFLDVTYGAPGVYLVTLWVSDGTNTAWTVIRIIASAQNPPLLVAPLPTVVFDEDTVGFNGLGAPTTSFFNDLDGDPLSFTVLDAVNISSRVNANDTIDFWAPLRWFGSETLRLRAMDPTGGFAEGAFLIIVRHVNHAPVLTIPFPAVAFNENTTAFDAFGGNAAGHFSDPDSDPLIISISGGVNITARINPNGTVDLWGVTNWSGSETFTVRGTDPSGAFVEGSFVATVMPVNHPPIVMAPLPTVIFDEDTVALNVFSGPVSVYFFDRDGDALAFTVIGGFNIFSRVNVNLTVDMWGATHWHGSENLLMRATDTNGSSVDAPFLAIVRHVNHPPVLVTAFPAVTFDEDTTAFNVFGGDAATNFLDVDGDPLTLAVLGGVQVSSRINPGGTVDLWGAIHWHGSDILRIRATDPNGSFAEGPFLVRVRHVNHPPTLLTPFPAVTFIEDTIGPDVFGGSAAAHFSDVDGDPLTISVLGGANVSSRINPNGNLDLWASAGWYGSETLRIRATDPFNLFADGTFLAIVQCDNDPPTLAPIPDLRIDDGAKLTLDLTPYISDPDTPVSQIFVSTDSNYVTANGRVLTLVYPGGHGDTSFTVTISDGNSTASRSVRIFFISPWWKSIYVLSLIPFSILLVVAMFAQRARGRPAKAFLVDERLRLLREFTFDPGCEVTYDEAVQAGALDAVERPVRVQRYHAQTVRGNALAVILLANGPIPTEQIDFAREMLVNVQDKFEHALKLRLEAARAAEANFGAAYVDRMKEMEEREARIRPLDTALSNQEASLKLREQQVQAQAEATSATLQKIASISRDVEQREAALSLDIDVLQQDRMTFETRQKEFEENAAHHNADVLQREEELDKQSKALIENQKRFATAKQEFEAIRDEKGQWIASKQLETESREQSLKEKEAALKTQSEENARRLSELVAREEALTNGIENLEKARIDIATQQEETSRLAKDTQAKALSLHEVEGLKAEEFRSWQATMDSEQALLREQREAFEKEATDQRESWMEHLKALEQREMALTEKESGIKTDLERLTSFKEEMAQREAEAKKVLKSALKASEEAESAKKASEDRALNLEQRERAFREEAARLTEELAQRSSALKTLEAESTARRDRLERGIMTSAKEVGDREAEVQRTMKALEARAQELSDHESALASREKDILEREDRLAREKSDFESTAKQLEAEEVNIAQAARRVEEEYERVQKERDAVRQSIAAKEAELRSEQERLERESNALQDKLGAKATELAELERKLVAREGEAGRSHQSLNSERGSWEAAREKEMKQLDAIRQDTMDSKQRAERLIEEAGQRELVAQESERTAKRQIEELNVLRVHIEEQRAAAEKAEREVEAQASRLQEASQQLGSREMKLQSLMNDFQARQTKLNAKAEESSKLEEQLKSRRASLEQDAARFVKFSADLDAQRDELQEKWAALEAKQTELTQRERILTSEFQHVENEMEDTKRKEEEMMTREQFVSTVQKEIAKRESILSKREADVKLKAEELKRIREEVEKQEAESEAIRTEAVNTNEEASALKAKAEKEKVQAEMMQKEVSKNMKFLQKKAVDILDKEEKLRTREQEIADRESLIEQNEQALRDEERILEAERTQMAAKVERANSEMTKLRERLAEAEKGTESLAEMMEWKKDVENRVKILQKKAMDILDREEQLRKREESLKALSEKLQVPI